MSAKTPTDSSSPSHQPDPSPVFVPTPEQSIHPLLAPSPAPSLFQRATSALSALWPFAWLPSYTGPYSVGVHDIEWADAPKPDNGQSWESGRVPLARGLLVRLYYPAQKGSGRGRPPWLPSAVYGVGYGYFVHASRYLVLPFTSTILAFARLPAQTDAAVSKEAPKSDARPPRFPLVVFSHGLGGMRTTYSHLCGDLASHGMVVMAIEHRDRSAGVTVVHGGSGLKAEDIYYERPAEVSDDDNDLRTWRYNQIRFRAAEVHAAVDLAKRLNSGGPYVNTLAPAPQIDERYFSPSQLRDRIDVDNIAMVGHSFGAATAAHVLQHQPHPFRVGALLDTWMFPIGTDVVTVPFLSLNSETFHWKENLRRLERLYGDGNSQRRRDSIYATVRGTAHQNHSDFPALFPRVLRLTRMGGFSEPVRVLHLHNIAILTFLHRYFKNPDVDIPHFETIFDKDGSKRPPEVELGLNGIGA